MGKKSGDRNRFIDVMKGVLIIFVIILHFPFNQNETRCLIFPYLIDMAVPGFMFISGYVMAMSFSKKNYDSIEGSYAILEILPRLLRFIIPYSLAFIAEWIVFTVFKLYEVGIKEYGILAFICDYFVGGKGQGSYYFPLMIQLVLIFPLIYFAIKKRGFMGLVLCFVLNGLYELVKYAYGVNEYTYRLLVFRYLFIIAAGTFFALYDISNTYFTVIISIASILIGALAIYLFKYRGMSIKVLDMWTTTNFVTGLYIVPIMGFLCKKGRGGFRPFEVIGKASFNIFLVQMIFYCVPNPIYNNVNNVYLKLLINITFCVTVGIIFYLGESSITRFVVRKVRSLSGRESSQAE